MHDRDTTDSIIAANFASSGFATVDRMADSVTLAQMRRAYDGMLDGTIPCSGMDRALGGLALQLRPCLDMGAFGRSLVGSSPEGPGDHFGGLDPLLSQPIGDAADFLDRPADQFC